MAGRRRKILVWSMAAALVAALAAGASAGGRAAQAGQPAQTWHNLAPRGGTDALPRTPGAMNTPAPTPTQAVNIGAATPIACGQAAAGTTVGAANNASIYSCAPWLPLTGPERVFSLSLDANTTVDALLSGMSSDLDLLLLTGANPASCVAQGDNAISARGLAAGVYYLVVDGFNGAAGPFRLDVWCPLAVTATPTPTITPTATPRPTLLMHYLPLLLHSVEARR
jgi:hypothetical protein